MSGYCSLDWLQISVAVPTRRGQIETMTGLPTEKATFEDSRPRSGIALWANPWKLWLVSLCELSRAWIDILCSGLLA